MTQRPPCALAGPSGRLSATWIRWRSRRSSGCAGRVRRAERRHHAAVIRRPQSSRCTVARAITHHFTPDWSSALGYIPPENEVDALIERRLWVAEVRLLAARQSGRLATGGRPTVPEPCVADQAIRRRRARRVRTEDIGIEIAEEQHGPRVPR